MKKWIDFCHSVLLLLFFQSSKSNQTLWDLMIFLQQTLLILRSFLPSFCKLISKHSWKNSKTSFTPQVGWKAGSHCYCWLNLAGCWGCHMKNSSSSRGGAMYPGSVQWDFCTQFISGFHLLDLDSTVYHSTLRVAGILKEAKIHKKFESVWLMS